VLEETDFEHVLQSELSKVGGKDQTGKFNGDLILDDVLRRLDEKILDAICSYLF
jgi:hypothetical protein